MLARFIMQAVEVPVLPKKKENQATIQCWGEREGMLGKMDVLFAGYVKIRDFKVSMI
jgi:hypothetical protein